MRTTVTVRGQTVVPAKIRRDHRITTSTQLEWVDDGVSIRVVPIPDDAVAAARGLTRDLGSRLLGERNAERDAD
ncbi:MAG: AbrB/MazE/SpoVT family DNA-binding domain-containing protein [Acidobacteria bacterium]|nr:AbrB/MazE/SpoVT family DNA-binding domain-containing protein [Acidobacteriota bacterium]